MSWLRLHVSNVCNFRCPNCHVFRLGKNELPSKVMPLETMKQAVHEYTVWLAELGLNRTTVSLYGGETLINRRNILSLIHDLGSERNSVRLDWVLNTNGSLLTAEDARFLKERDVDVHVSCDGPEEIHDAARPDRAGKGTFHSVLNALRILRDAGARTQINSYCAPRTLEHLHELIDIAASSGVNRLYLDLFYQPGMRLDRKFLSRYEDAYLYGQNQGVAVTGSWSSVLRNAITGSRAERDRLTSVDVNVNGTFYFGFFPSTKEKGWKLAEFATLVRSPGYAELVVKARDWYSSRCSDCSIYGSCHGKAIQQFLYHLGSEEGCDAGCEFMQHWIPKRLSEKIFEELKRQRSEHPSE